MTVVSGWYEIVIVEQDKDEKGGTPNHVQIWWQCCLSANYRNTGNPSQAMYACIHRWMSQESDAIIFWSISLNGVLFGLYPSYPSQAWDSVMGRQGPWLNRRPVWLPSSSRGNKDRDLSNQNYCQLQLRTTISLFCEVWKLCSREGFQKLRGRVESFCQA